jgi:hypothetical protein
MTAPDKDGWTNWAGGRNAPIPRQTPCTVRFRAGDQVRIKDSTDVLWSHAGGPDDVVAYRLESLHAQPEPDGFTHESPIRAFTDWTVNGRYAIGKGFRPSLQHLTVYLDAMDRLEGWALLQVLEAASGSPSFVFRKAETDAMSEAKEILSELSGILNDDDRAYVQEILTRAHFLIEGNRP